MYVYIILDVYIIYVYAIVSAIRVEYIGTLLDPMVSEPAPFTNAARVFIGCQWPIHALDGCLTHRQ